MMLSIETKCSFCGTMGPMQRCKEEDWSPEKKLKLQANPDTHSALHEALTSKDCSAVCHLLEAGETLCSTDGIENCFILITQFYTPECVERELSRQPCAIHCRGPQGQTLLMYAKHIDMMKTLFKFGPDVNACNDNGENVLIKLIQEVDADSPSFDMFCEMANYVIIIKGINVNAKDALGGCAAKYLMEFDVKRNYLQPPPQIDGLLTQLLRAQATFPQVDSIGRTILMHFARRAYIPENFIWMEDKLMEFPINAEARDQNGNNLMYYVIKSHFDIARKNIKPAVDLNEYFFDTMYSEWARIAGPMANKCDNLLSYDCELGGLDQICIPRQFFQFKIDRFGLMKRIEVRSISMLSLLLHSAPFSSFILKLPEYNLNLSKSDDCISELTYYLLGYKEWQWDCTVLFNAVGTTVMHLLANGVNVMQQTEEAHYILNDDADLSVPREVVDKLPDALWLAGKMLLKYAGLYHNRKVRGARMYSYPITCKILVTLLRFWSYPPLALFMFLYTYDREAPVLAMLKFLTRVGGRLPPGSPLFKCLKMKLETYANRNPRVGELPQVFNELHGEIPSLKELCRPAVRATLSKVTTSGLDLSSLRVLYEGEMRELPKNIEDYLDFNDQPEFCEDDLDEFDFDSD